MPAQCRNRFCAIARGDYLVSFEGPAQLTLQTLVVLDDQERFLFAHGLLSL